MKLDIKVESKLKAAKTKGNGEQTNATVHLTESGYCRLQTFALLMQHLYNETGVVGQWENGRRKSTV